MPDCFITVERTIVPERQSVTAKSYYRNALTDADEAPTTAEYRVDCLTTGTALVDWTSLTPAATINISVPSNANRLISNGNQFEKKQITLSADRNTTGETRSVVAYKVENIRGFEG